MKAKQRFILFFKENKSKIQKSDFCRRIGVFGFLEQSIRHGKTELISLFSNKKCLDFRGIFFV